MGDRDRSAAPLGIAGHRAAVRRERDARHHRQRGVRADRPVSRQRERRRDPAHERQRDRDGSIADSGTARSLLPGQLELGTRTLDRRPTPRPGSTCPMPSAGRWRTVSLIPLPPSDLTTPPYTFPITIPLVGMPFSALDLPTNSRTLRGLVRDAIGNPKVAVHGARFSERRPGEHRADARRRPRPIPRATSSSSFRAAPPATASRWSSRPMSGTSDPWVTYTGLSLTQQNTDLDAIKLPAALTTTPFQVTVHGGDADETPVSGATVRAYTTLEGGDARVSAKFARDGVSDGGGTANMSLMPGATDNPRPYTLSVVPPAGSIWATQCLDNVPAQWPGGAPVTLAARCDAAAPGGDHGKRSCRRAGCRSPTPSSPRPAAPPPMPHCLAGPAATSTTTDATGSFTLPLDPGTYQLEYDPPAGSPLPRMIEPDRHVTTADAYRTVVVRLPAPVLVEGDVLKAPGIPLPYATVRIFEPRCLPDDGPVRAVAARGDADGRQRAFPRDRGGARHELRSPGLLVYDGAGWHVGPSTSPLSRLRRVACARDELRPYRAGSAGRRRRRDAGAAGSVGPGTAGSGGAGGRRRRRGRRRARPVAASWAAPVAAERVARPDAAAPPAPPARPDAAAPPAPPASTGRGGTTGTAGRGGAVPPAPPAPQDAAAPPATPAPDAAERTRSTARRRAAGSAEAAPPEPVARPRSRVGKPPASRASRPAASRWAPPGASRPRRPVRAAPASAASTAPPARPATSAASACSPARRPASGRRCAGSPAASSSAARPRNARPRRPTAAASARSGVCRAQGCF